jgi:kynurenine formamidase
MKKPQLIDLSITIEPDLPSDPPMMVPQVEYVDHDTGAQQMEQFFPGLMRKDLPKGLGWALEKITLTTHSGTHLDAPYHYHPTMDRGKRALTIDQIPLEWCFSDGVRLDFRHKSDGDRITADDVQQELDRIGYTLKPLDIVLIQTGADDAWGTEKYLTRGAGMDRESTLFLTERGIRLAGIDAWSWDRPLPFWRKSSEERVTPALSGRRISQASKPDTATWKRWPIWTPFPCRSALRCAVFPSRSRTPARDGCAPWRWSECLTRIADWEL